MSKDRRCGAKILTLQLFIHNKKLIQIKSEIVKEGTRQKRRKLK